MDPARRSAAMWSMAVDAVSAEVITALEKAGIESLLLKGPTIATWLYADPAERPYIDTDVLVDPAGLAAAHAALGDLGFGREFGPLTHPGMENPPSYPWRRGEFTVDLHETLPRAHASRAHVWLVLRSKAVEQRVGGRLVRVLSRPARLAHVAVHAAHHGAAVEPPLRDLRRALAQVDDDEWQAAAHTADEIGASAAFSTGLFLLAEGRDLAARLDLAIPSRALGETEHPLVDGLERLRATRGSRARALVLREELLPSAEFMRWWLPFARRSRRGLIASYGYRWAHFARHAPKAVLALRRRDPS